MNEVSFFFEIVLFPYFLIFYFCFITYHSEISSIYQFSIYIDLYACVYVSFFSEVGVTSLDTDFPIGLYKSKCAPKKNDSEIAFISVGKIVSSDGKVFELVCDSNSLEWTLRCIRCWSTKIKSRTTWSNSFFTYRY
jgi:hypothetical protein